MGRHSAPQTGEPSAPRRGLVAIVVVMLALVAGVAVAAAVRNSDDGTTTTGQPAPASHSRTPDAMRQASTAAPSSSSSSVAESPTVSSTPAKRAPTLDLRLVGSSYVTVRLPGGRTLISKLLHKGQHKVFDQRALEVVIGNAAAVRVTVNGKERKRGARGDVATFTVRRR